jgi:hypothetical protein
MTDYIKLHPEMASIEDAVTEDDAGWFADNPTEFVRIREQHKDEYSSAQAEATAIGNKAPQSINVVTRVSNKETLLPNTHVFVVNLVRLYDSADTSNAGMRMRFFCPEPTDTYLLLYITREALREASFFWEHVIGQDPSSMDQRAAILIHTSDEQLERLTAEFLSLLHHGE